MNRTEKYLIYFLVRTKEGRRIIKIDIALVKNEKYENNGLNIKDNRFLKVMELYENAMHKVEKQVNSINDDYREIYKEDLINHVVSRIKSPDSIVKKMKRKGYELTYQSLVENVQDIAGVRIICPFKTNVFDVIDIIKGYDNFRVIKEKDYISKPKKTGYSSYHMIVEVPVEVDEIQVYATVEIQLRTMAMDFWATLEHELKYKSAGELSPKVSKDLVTYAKIINKIDNRLLKIHNKRQKNLELSD